MTRLLSALFASLLLVLAGCTSTTTTTSSATPGGAVEPDKVRVAKARLELAGLYLGRGQANVALEEIKRALVAKPDMPEAYNLFGLVYATLGDTAQAEASFQRALQLAPQDGDTMHNYGWFLCQQRRWADSEAQFAAALQQPQYREPARTLMAQGVCLARAGRWLDAERALARSFELDPGNPVVAYNLSDVLLHRGELQRARFYVARLNGQPELVSAQSLWLAARIERRIGNVQGVQDFGRKLQERFPESNEAQLYERGRFDE